MRPLWIVFSREVAERRLLLAGALALGVIPFLYSLLPNASGAPGDAAEMRLQMGGLLALVAMAITALILGSTILARDLAERRLSFYFTRPIPGWAVWGGKLLAALLLSLAAGLFIFLPSALAGWSALPGLLSGSAIAGGLALLLFVLGLAHAWSVSLRARTPWLVLDLAATFAPPLVVLAATRHVLRHSYLSPSLRHLPYFATGALLFMVLAAGAVQVVRGRTDLRRGHRLLSLSLGAGLLALTLAWLGYCRWALAIEPADLRSVSVAGSPAGPWVSLTGEAAYRGGYFLQNLDTGGFLLLPGSRFPVSFSEDGKLAYWFSSSEPWSTAAPTSLALVDLTAARPRIRTLPFSLAHEPVAYQLSPDGSRLATLESGRLLVYALPRGDVLASAPVPEATLIPRLRFLDARTVRLYAGELRKESVVVFDLDLTTNRLQRRGAWPGLHTLYWESLSPDGRSLLLWDGAARQSRLVDVETGTTTDLEPPQPGSPNAPRNTWGSFLPDGRLVLVTRKEDIRTLRIFAAGTLAEHRLDFPAGTALSLGGQPAPDRLLVTASRRLTSPGGEGSTLYLVDLKTGTARPIARGLRPVFYAWQAGPASVSSKLFYRRGQGVVRLDLETGQETRISAAQLPQGD